MWVEDGGDRGVVKDDGEGNRSVWKDGGVGR